MLNRCSKIIQYIGYKQYIQSQLGHLLALLCRIQIEGEAGVSLLVDEVLA